MSELEPGSVVAGYRIQELLGRGAMGAVFRAVRAKDGLEVALKVLAADLGADPELRLRFEREGRAALAISHPHVVACHELARAEGRLVLALELVPGGSLEDLLKRRGALPPLEAARLGAQVARGLAAIHGAGVVHRDLKPANVLLDASGDAKVTDFGLAGETAASRLGFTGGLTATGELVGTPNYMAPEQVDDARRATERSDLYALGCILFALLTSEPPFKGGKLTVLQHHLEKAAPAPGERVKGVPAALDRLVVALLAKKPGDRPASATAVALELEAIARGRGERRSPLLVVLALVVVGLVAVGAAIVLRRTSPPPPGPPPSVPSPPPLPATPAPADELSDPAGLRAEAERVEGAGKSVEAFAAWSRVIEATESSSPLAVTARARLRRLASMVPRSTAPPTIFRVKALVFEHMNVPGTGAADLEASQEGAIVAAIEDWKDLVAELTRGVLKLECDVERVPEPVTRLANWAREGALEERMPVPYDLPIDLRPLRRDYDSVIACVPLGSLRPWGVGGGDFRAYDEGIPYTGFPIAGATPTGLDFLHCWLGVVWWVLAGVQGWPEPAFIGDGGTRVPLGIRGEPGMETREAAERIMTECVTERMWRELSTRTVHPNPWNKGDVHEWRLRPPKEFLPQGAGVGLIDLADVSSVSEDAEVVRSGLRALDLGLVHPGDWRATVLETWVSVPKAVPVRFLLAHDDGAELFVNGSKVWGDAGGHQLSDWDRAEGSLAAGWNRIDVHLENQTGGWGVGLRIRDREGRPIPGILVSHRSPVVLKR